MHGRTWQRFAIILVLSCAFAASCGSPPKSSSDDDDGAASGSGSGGGQTTEPGGPVIHELIVTPGVVGPYDAVTFSAVVSDPDGFEDIGAGKLVSEDGALTFGVFIQVSEGAFTLPLSWEQIHQLAPIAFGKDEKPVRIFRAEFTDSAGKLAWTTAQLTLACGAGEAACDGECREVDVACPAPTDCQTTTDAPKSCQQICGSQGLSCSDGCEELDYEPVRMYQNAGCADEPAGWYPYCDDGLYTFPGDPPLYFRCCCG